MRQRGVIFLDVDGVLCEWFKPFIKFCNDNGVCLRFDELVGYNIEKLPCWEKESQCFQFIGDFARTEEWRSLPPLAYAESLWLLKGLGYSVRVLSQVSNVDAQAKRAKMLCRYFGPVFDGIHFTTHKESKETYILRFMDEWSDHYGSWPEVWMLDDKPSLIRDLAKVRRARETNGYGSLINPIGINNREDHPYLTDSMTSVKFAFMEEVRLFKGVNHFAEWMALRVMKEDFRG